MVQMADLTATFRKQPGWLALSGILFIYALLIVPTVNRLGMGWDEATDLWISRSYLSWNGLLFGLSRDLSQTRLPMFVVALVFYLLGMSSLLIARFTTVIVGGLTLLGVYVYGRDQFSHKTGLLAAGLLAINPFFLSFARLGFTESDVYLACTLVWLLVIVSRLQRTNSLGYAALSGVMLGLSVSAKATSLVILPALFGALILRRASDRTADVSTKSIPARTVFLWAGAGIVILIAGLHLSRYLDTGNFRRLFHLLNYILVWLGWLGILGWAVRYRHHTAHPTALFVYLTTLGLLTFVILPPDHLVNSGIIQKLFSRAETEMTFSLAFIGELAALHLFTIFLKSTPWLGLSLLAGFVASVIQWKRRELTLPLLVVGIYGLGLLLLPLAQTFYTIPILPILSVLAADQLLHFYSQRRRLVLALIIPGLIWWGVEMRQCYPDYHLNGYQWVGERPFFGRSSIGYRSIVYVPSDGVEQVVEWLNANAETGQVAQLYVEPWHIVNSMAPDPVYEITDGFDGSLDTNPDYVVVHIGAVIWQGEGGDTPQGSVYRYPFEPDVLTREYEKVFVVRRAFDLEMASVWRRK
jgi:4-amino-4-deoxy-L-arabinose transferase-like glycosyltransferase